MVDIYMITNKLTDQRYVGKSQRGYELRFKEHCFEYKYGNRTYISNAIHKYGKNNFTIELLAQVEDDSWEFWETYYILEKHSHYTEGGYNITYGGDSNPMDIDYVRKHHSEICKSQWFRELQRQLSLGKKHSEKTKELCRKNTLANLDVCLKGFRQYNNARKQKVAIIDNDVIVKVFESASDACRYCNRNITEAGNILRSCDLYNKNGKRAKFFGYSWTKL